MPTEKRKHPRSPCGEKIVIVLKDGASYKESEKVLCTVENISSTGMGIETDFLLRKGETIFFLQNQPKWDLPSGAIVIWSFTQNSLCRAGLEFLF